MFFRIFCIAFCLFVFSCQEKTSKRNDRTPVVLQPEELLDAAPRSLELSYYLVLLQNMKHVTFDESESQEHRLSILYKPQIIEAALSLDAPGDSSSYHEMLERKAGYHYLLISYQDKIPSVTGVRESKEETLKKIQQRLLVIKNGTDTLHQVITETVSSSVMGQPDQVMVLVPQAVTDKRLRIEVPTDFTDIHAVYIDLEIALLKRLPQLKL